MTSPAPADLPPAVKTAATGSSFYYAFLFLPPEKRRAITAFYAFCRKIDDVVDEVSDPSVAQAKLNWWRTEVRKLATDQASHPALLGLRPHMLAYGIREDQLLAVIDGCQMDLDQTRYLDFPALQRYCHLVAGVVGEVAASIFGPASEPVTRFAHELGLAFQLTNIIRDVGEDALRGRIYLPMDELKRFDVKAHEIVQRQYSDRFTALMRFQAQRAHEHYDRAMAELPKASRRDQKPSLMMANIYRTLLREIEHDQFQVLHQRIALTPVRKFWLAWKVQALGWL